MTASGFHDVQSSGGLVTEHPGPGCRQCAATIRALRTDLNRSTDAARRAITILERRGGYGYLDALAALSQPDATEEAER
jgi:hypothetical protein